MDSQRCIQEANRMNDYDLHITGNKVDLTLKLGLLDTDSDQFLSHLEQCVNPVPNPMTPHHANLNFSGRCTQGINQHGIFNSSESPQGEHNFNANQIKYSQEMGSHAYNMQPNELGQFTSSLVGLPPYTNSYDNFNPNLAPTPPVTINAYTLLDPPRRVERELRISSSDARRRGTRRQHAGGNNDPTKKCTNYNCKTNDTPMWRKGPLGPKTLCNECGIKYRKEEEKKRAREAANSNRLNGQMKEKLQNLKY